MKSKKRLNNVLWITKSNKIPSNKMLRVQVEKGKDKAVFEFVGNYNEESQSVLYWKDFDTMGEIPIGEINRYQILQD